MNFLVFQICCGTMNHLLMKLFHQQSRNLIAVIVVNYAICVPFGFSLSRGPIESSLCYYALPQGILLFNGIWLLGISTGAVGVAITALFARLALVIPVLAAFLYFGEEISAHRITGITLALAALSLAIPSKQSSKSSELEFSKLFFPVLMFLNAGSYMLLLNYVNVSVISPAQKEQYVALTFLFGFLVSLLALCLHRRRTQALISKKDFLWGIALGINNFGAVYFLLRSLADSGLESSVVFPSLSIGVLIMSTLSARVLFKEALTQRKIYALIMGCLAVALLQRS